MNDYQYDVFISYRFNTPCSKWIHYPFQEVFEYFLTQELGRKPTIYLPPAQPGEDWTAVIRQNLACSRTLLPILTTEYFWEDAEWCLLEFGTIWERERKLGYRTVSNPGGLIVPVIVGDGDDILSIIGDRIHVADFKSHMRPTKGFMKSPRSVKFWDDVERFVPHVARAIQIAPPWDPQWLIDDLVRFARHTPTYIPDPSM